MRILDDLISTLDFDAPVRDIRQGVFHTGVLSRHCGLAATLPRDALRQRPPLVEEPGFLLDKNARELTQLVYSESILEAAIGMAALNSLLDVDERAVVELNAGNLILEKGEGKRVAIVGHFPFVPEAYVILLGDTVPLSPVLFDYGVEALSGTRVADSDLALQCISQGANFRQIKGTRRLTMIRPGSE